MRGRSGRRRWSRKLGSPSAYFGALMILIPFVSTAATGRPSAGSIEAAMRRPRRGLGDVQVGGL